MRFAVLTALAVVALAGAARAEVADKGPQGFRLKTIQQISAPPEKVFKALGEIGRWWSDDHTYSGKASNMTMPLTPNACFCEAVPGGGVRHGVVELVLPSRMVRIDAALGPLQDEGAAGALTFELKPQAAGTELTVTYNVGGARDAMVSAAPAVDRVLTEQAVRLKRYVETGKP